jgi:hypothetical protein
MLLSALFQKRVSYFTVDMLLLQDTTISEQDMRIGVLESSSLAKLNQLVMDKAVLNSI